ncbi:MAG: alternative ribosome rescue aminoacyl-tRNA hydrolase ArfB [Actinomycetes bacterium]
MSEPIRINGWVSIPRSELSVRFSRSSGPGGQGVNTTDSRVELTFDLAHSQSLTQHFRDRAIQRLGSKLVDGTLTVVASEHRSQRQNRQAAEKRLVETLAAAFAPPPAPRRKTKPSRSSVQKRITAKKRRGETKRLRGNPDG